MKERIIDFFKKLLSIKVIIGLPLITYLLINSFINEYIFAVLFAAILGFREALKVINK